MLMTSRTVTGKALALGAMVVTIGGLNLQPAQAQFFMIESAPVVGSAPFFDQSSHQPLTIGQNHAIGHSAHDIYMPSHSNIYTPSREIMRIQTPHRVYHQPPHRVYQAPTVYYQRTEIVSPDGSQRVILEDPVGYSPGYYSVSPRTFHRHHRPDRHPASSSIRIPVTNTQRFIYRF
jgi:hypothetical protein